MEEEDESFGNSFVSDFVLDVDQPVDDAQIPLPALHSLDPYTKDESDRNFHYYLSLLVHQFYDTKTFKRIQSQGPKEKFITHLFRCPAPNPISMDHGIHFDRVKIPEKYAVAPKVDGTRYQLLLLKVQGQPRSFLVDRSMRFFEISCEAPQSAFEGTLLDGEITFSKDSDNVRRLTLLFFDAVAVAGNQKCRTWILEHRTRILRNIVPHITIRSRETQIPTMVKDIFDVSASGHLVASLEQFPYPVDGLVFTPRDESIGKFTHPTLFKVKNTHTVDLLLRLTPPAMAQFIKPASNTFSDVPQLVHPTKHFESKEPARFTQNRMNNYMAQSQKNTNMKRKNRKRATPAEKIRDNVEQLQIKNAADIATKQSFAQIMKNGDIHKAYFQRFGIKSAPNKKKKRTKKTPQPTPSTVSSDTSGTPDTQNVQNVQKEREEKPQQENEEEKKQYPFNSIVLGSTQKLMWTVQLLFLMGETFQDATAGIDLLNQRIIFQLTPSSELSSILDTCDALWPYLKQDPDKQKKFQGSPTSIDVVIECACEFNKERGLVTCKVTRVREDKSGPNSFTVIARTLRSIDEGVRMKDLKDVFPYPAITEGQLPPQLWIQPGQEMPRNE